MFAIYKCQRGDLAARLLQVLQRHLGMLYGLSATCIWGGYLAVINHGVSEGLEANDLAFLRFSVAGLLLLPFWLRNRPLKIGGVGWAKGLTLALLAGPAFVIVGASGFAFAPLAHSAVLQLGTVTLLGTVFAGLITGSRFDKQHFVGLAILVTGLAVTAGPDILTGAPGVWRGDLLFFAAGGMWALFTVLLRYWRVDPMAATASVSVLSGLIYSPLYLAEHGLSAFASLSVESLLLQALVLGVLTGIVALYSYGRAIEMLGPSRAALLPALTPAAAILIGALIGSGLPSSMQSAGLVVLSVGLVLVLRRS